MFRRTLTAASLAVAVSTIFMGPAVAADPARDDLLASLAAEAGKADPAFTGFAVERGAAFYAQVFGTGKPETPSCSGCHGETPEQAGRTRAGKVIEPMALSRTPSRFTDPAKVAKWFGRNCRSVLGRECTAREKGDFLTFMISR